VIKGPWKMSYNRTSWASWDWVEILAGMRDLSCNADFVLKWWNTFKILALSDWSREHWDIPCCLFLGASIVAPLDLRLAVSSQESGSRFVFSNKGDFFPDTQLRVLGAAQHGTEEQTRLWMGGYAVCNDWVSWCSSAFLSCSPNVSPSNYYEYDQKKADKVSSAQYFA